MNDILVRVIPNIKVIIIFHENIISCFYFELIFDVTYCR